MNQSNNPLAQYQAWQSNLTTQQTNGKIKC